MSDTAEKKRLLIVEDDAVALSQLVEFFEDGGFDEIHTASTVEEAVALMESMLFRALWTDGMEKRYPRIVRSARSNGVGKIAVVSADFSPSSEPIDDMEGHFSKALERIQAV